MSDDLTDNFVIPRFLRKDPTVSESDNRRLVGDRPVTPDHREIDPATGLQKDYVVLSPEERAKGFVRPYRDSYVSATCV